MYIFGVDIPLVEIIFALSVILLILLFLSIFLYIRSRKQQKNILDIIMKLEDKEIDELNKLISLSSREKHFLKEVKVSKKTGVNIVSSRQKEREKIAGSIFEKFIGSPEIKNELLKNIKGLNKQLIKKQKEVSKKSKKDTKKSKGIFGGKKKKIKKKVAGSKVNLLALSAKNVKQKKKPSKKKKR